MVTALWSETPEITSVDFTREGLLVKNKSRVLHPRVASVTVWDRPSSLTRSIKRWLMHRAYRGLGEISKEGQFISGRLKSPASQKMESLNLSLTSKISVQSDSR